MEYAVLHIRKHQARDGIVEAVRGRGAGNIWGLSVLPAQFRYEPKTALKKLSLLVF